MKQSSTVATSKRDITALALLGAMFIALALIGSASLSAVRPNLFQELAGAVGFGRSSPLEAEQQRQAAVIESLQRTISAVSADVRTLTARAKVAENDAIATDDRFALVDGDMASLAEEVHTLRLARAESPAPAQPAEPVQAAETVQNDILALRASIDEHDQAYRKDIGAVAKDVGALTKRLDRLEQAVSRDLTGSIRPPARKKMVRRKPRPDPSRIKAEIPGTMTWGGNPQAPFARFGAADPVGTPQ